MHQPIIPKITGLLHGGDYNPEQWTPNIWEDDMRLMGPARFDIATVGVFSWAKLEPKEGQFEFGWLDQVLDLLAKNGRHADIATPSAAMPAWLANKYPEVRRVSPDGERMRHGRRVNFCWTSPVYRDKVQQIATKLAERYGKHPALAFWHISNEYGERCYCDLCQNAFRQWLRRKFNDDLDALNHAYWTTFWSHVYGNWDEIEIPGAPYGEDAIVGLALDWYRYSSDQIIDFFKQESAPMRRLTPDIPITTNFMGFYPVIDYPKMAELLDFTSWDSYPLFARGPLTLNKWVDTSMSHDVTRSMKKQPYLMIESTPDGSNWYPVMRLKRPGVHVLEGAQAIAHGSEGVMYFQFRKGRGSSEQYHGAVVGHDGTSQTRVYKEVAEMGQTLADWADVRGSTVESEIALIYDWEINWAIELTHVPRQKNRDYHRTVLSHYQALWQAGVSVDIVSSTVDFSGYKVVVAPMLYLLKPGVADAIRKFVADGGTFVLTYWSAMADENTLAIQGGYPGGLRDVFGIWAEETDSLFEEETMPIKGLGGNFMARQFCDLVHLEAAEALAHYDADFYKGTPCLTRNRYGKGEAYFVASRNDDAFQTAFMKMLCDRADIKPALSTPTPVGVTVQKRSDGKRDFFFILNYTDQDQAVNLDENLLDMDGSPAPTMVKLEPHGVRLFVKDLTPPKTPEMTSSGTHTS